MVDVVLNNMAAPNSTSFNNSLYKPFDQDRQPFHPQCWIEDWNNQTEVEQCWLGDDSLPLPDLDTEDAVVIDQLHSFVQDLVKTYGVDGLKLNSLKHVTKDFWSGVRTAAGTFTLGEVRFEKTLELELILTLVTKVMTDSTAYLDPYTGTPLDPRFSALSNLIHT